MWESERRWLGVSAGGHRHQRESQNHSSPSADETLCSHSLTLTNVCVCGCVDVCVCEYVHSKIPNYSSERLTSICRLMLEPYLFLFHLLRIKDCSPIEIGSITDRFSRENVEVWLYVCVREGLWVCVWQRKNIQDLTWPPPAGCPTFCLLTHTHTVILMHSLYLWQRTHQPLGYPSRHCPSLSTVHKDSLLWVYVQCVCAC